MMNYLRAVEKNKQAPPSTPTRLQGKEKRSKLTTSTVATSDQGKDKRDQKSDDLHPSPEPNQDDTQWKHVTTKKQNSAEATKKKNKAAKKKLLTDSDDSNSEAEDEEESKLNIPEKKKEFLLQQATRARFSLVMDIDPSLEPTQYLKHSVSLINKVLKRITSMGQLQGQSGRAVMIPWEDKAVYATRAWNRAKRSTEHTSLLTFVRQIAYGYGAPKGRKQDTKFSKKFCRINIAWISSDDLSEDQLADYLSFLHMVKLSDPDSFALYPAPTDAVAPTIAVQFRHSIVSNPSNWTDKGHEDCFGELNKMIRSFLPPGTIAGLKKVTFATGQNFLKGDPTMVTLECEKHEEQLVTKDILSAFRSVNRKAQIRDKASVPWIAVPYFKGQGIQANQKYSTQYVEIKAKEALYQNDIMMKYIDHVHSLDTTATTHFHLSKELLKQLEQDIWNRNETPVRALIYDKLLKETRESLLEAKLSSLENPSAATIASIKKKITYHQILDEMARKGYETLAPYDECSFPLPNPSTRTLREYLMSMKSRRTENAAEAPYVFESVNLTDDGRVLCTFTKNNMEEATTVLDCLPLMIQHEMHLDPSCFLSQMFMKTNIGSYYNPLTRTGFTAIAASLQDDIPVAPNPKHYIPKEVQTASAKVIEHLFKRKENKMFTFSDDADLASIAGSIASYKGTTKIQQHSPSENIVNLQMLLQTHHLGKLDKDEVSNLSDGSGLSFDSKTSKNKYEIERRADQLALKKTDDKILQLKIQQGISLLKVGSFTRELADTLDIPYDEVLKLSSSQQQDPTPPLSITVDEVFLDAQMEDPLKSQLPESDEDSDATPVRKSPNKLMAAGGQNIGENT